MICVATYNADGRSYVVIADPQPVDVTTCGAVLASPQEIGQSPFALTTEQAAQIGGAILAVWAIAWCVRMLVRALDIDEHNQKESSE